MKTLNQNCLAAQYAYKQSTLNKKPLKYLRHKSEGVYTFNSPFSIYVAPWNSTC